MVINLYLLSCLFTFFIPFILTIIKFNLIYFLYKICCHKLHNFLNFLCQISNKKFFYQNNFMNQKYVDKVHLYNTHKNINFLEVYLITLLHMLKKFHKPNTLKHFKLCNLHHHSLYKELQNSKLFLLQIHELQCSI